MSRDPRDCGAQCDRCPLRGSVPVFAEANPGATTCLVGEAPGAEEVREGRPFVGASGQELQRGLNAAHLPRRRLHITNVILCQPPKNELKNMLAKINSENRERDKRNKARKKQYDQLVKHQPWLKEPEYELLIPSPIECCAPRLYNEVKQFTDFITLGGTAARAIMNTSMSILALRGGAAEMDATDVLPARRVLPTVHPSFVLRAQRWAHVFRSDLARARIWFTEGLDWKPPVILLHPDADQLEAFLFGQENIPYWTYDIETDGIEPLTAKIRCIGIGTPGGHVALVGLLGKDGVTKFYPEKEELRVIEVLKRFFTDNTKIKAGHNSGSYDSMCIMAQMGVWPAPQMDTILLHRLTESELPHSLGFVGSLYTSAPSWKTDREGRKLAFDAESDEQLHEYCLAGDTQVFTEFGLVPISVLVGVQWKGEVLSRSASGALEWRRVTGWHYNEDPTTKWVCVKLRAGRRGYRKQHSLVCTPDHRLIGPSGETEAQALRPGDSVYGVTPPGPYPTAVLHQVVSVAACTPIRGKTKRYCLDVEENHNFFTAAGLVHNCAMDVKVTSAVLPKLFDAVRLRGQAGLIESDHKVQRICSDMHRVGMYVYQDKRLVFEQKYIQEIGRRLKELQAMAPEPNFNPGSPHQVRRLIFDRWNLVAPVEDKERFTASGDPATSDLILRSLLTLQTLTPEQHEFILKLRRYRKAQKLLGTYIVKLRLSTMQAELGWDDDEEEEEKALREKYGIERTGIVDPRTGRMHPGYNSHVAVCVTPDTWIISRKGFIQIGKVRGFGPDQSEQEAVDLDLHDGAGFHTVSHLQNPGTCPTRRITTVLGITLCATQHHRVQVAKRNKFLWQASDGSFRKVSPDPIWMRMDELEPKKHYLRVPIGMDIWSDEVPVLPAVARPPDRTNAKEIWLPRILDEDLAFFAGAYTADGSLHDANGSFGIRISGRASTHMHADVVAAARRLFGEAAVAVYEDCISIQSVALAPWAEALKLGRRIENKEIPEWILAAPKPFVLAYLRGLARDSSMYINSGVTATWRYTGTEKLARALQMILLNLGIVAGLEDVSTPRMPQTWCLYAQSSEAEAICTLTGQVLPTPTRIGDTSQARPKYIRRGNVLWLRVTSVEETGMLPVLDVTIPDGHRFWANGTVSHNTGRLSSSKPINAQNFPKGLRAMVGAQPGHALIGADADQLELRIAAAHWGAERYLRAFDAGADPHSSTALACFRERFQKAEGFPGGRWDGDLFIPDGTGKWTGEAKTFRDLSKKVQYASQYWATVETVARVIRQTEEMKDDGSSSLPYLHLGLSEVRAMHEAWLDGCPEFPKGWEREVAEYRKQGYLLDPVAGRRRDFLDGENPNEIVNFKIQSAAAGLMNKAIIQFAEEVAPFKWGPGTGMINQCHDALVAEVPADGATPQKWLNPSTGKEEIRWDVPKGSIPWKVMHALNECMNQTHPNLPRVKITAAADIGQTWKEVG